jgi:hypothetical protein
MPQRKPRARGKKARQTESDPQTISVAGDQTGTGLEFPIVGIGASQGA